MKPDARRIFDLIRTYGAKRLRAVRLRANVRTIWSLTQDGSVLNLHRAFVDAPVGMFEDFAVVVDQAYSATDGYRRAAARIASWPPLHHEIRRLRQEREAKNTARSAYRGLGACAATERQRAYLQRLYAYLNETRFQGQLPTSVPLRLSSRMRSRLGQMVPGDQDGEKCVVEIALNIDLLLPGNDRVCVQTLLHEMAHVADYLFHGEIGHGATWKAWARRVGCEASSCTRAHIRHRKPRSAKVTRVPPLPLGARVRLTRA